jgi:hypothetical protein
MQHFLTQKNGRSARLIFYVLFFGFFAILPLSSVVGHFVVCPVAALGYQCPGCGVTRAMTLLMKGHFVEAFSLNAVFCTTLFPAAVLTVAQDLFVMLTHGKESFLEYVLGLGGGNLGGK